MLYSKLRILYLAKYAPTTDEIAENELNNYDGVASTYHFEIYKVLKQLGFDVICSRSIDFMLNNADKFDYVFSIYNRMPYRNSEILVSAVCEYLRKPYLGGSPTVRSIAEDKNLCKIIAANHMVPTPEWRIYRSVNDLENMPNFVAPYFVKPRFGASSEFVDEESFVADWDNCKKRIEVLLKSDTEVIVEQFIPGINLTLPIIFSDPPVVLPVIAATSDLTGNILSFKKKRKLETGIVRTLFNNSHVCEKCKDYATSIYTALCSPLDYARFDFRYDENNDQLSFLEFNVCCNLGTHSSFCQSAAAENIPQIELTRTILQYSFQRQGINWDGL